MQVTIDDITRDKIVSSLQHHLAEDTRDMSEPIHLSDITRCLTKSTLSRMTAEYNQSDIEANAAQIIQCFLSQHTNICLLYTSPSPRDRTRSRMPSSA